MKRMLVFLLLAAAAIGAQDAKKTDAQPKKDVVQKLFILKYADPGQLTQLFTVFDAQVRQSPELHAITVEASPAAMHAIEDAIQKLDVPSALPKNVEMTCFLLLASDVAQPGPEIPKDLDSVVTQLKGAFPFKNYSLLDAINFQTRTRQQVRTSSNGSYIPPGGTKPMSVNISLNLNGIALDADNNTLRVEGLSASFRVPVPGSNGLSDTQFNYTDLSIRTDLDMKVGQKVVVGRLGIGRDQALFVVMTGKVL